MRTKNRMRILIVSALALITVVFPAGSATTITSPAAAEPPAQVLAFEYAVKFICGVQPVGGNILSGGRYFTAINVHNPQATVATFRKKVAVAFPLQQPGPVSNFFTASLGPDRAFEIDCQDIFNMIALSPVPVFLKGFVVIQSPVELDIVVVYTAGPNGGNVSTMHQERVPPRRIG